MAIDRIVKDSVLGAKTLLSKNTNLANFTTGMPNGLNVFSPVLTSPLVIPTDPRIGNYVNAGIRFLLNDYKIASNLQFMADEVVEPLLETYGSDLMVYTAYQNPLFARVIGDKLSKHFTGEALCIFCRSAQDNMYLEAENILKTLKGTFTRATVHYNNASWMRLETNGSYSFNKEDRQNPVLASIDHASGMASSGIVPMRGTVKNPWAIAEYAPFRSFG